MSDKTAIAWTDATWNPISALRIPPAESVTPEGVVGVDVAPRPPTGIVAEEFRPTATRAFDYGVRFARTAAFMVPLSMASRVMESGFNDLEVFGAVVSLIPVAVMDDFARPQRAAEHLLSDQPVFVDVAPGIRRRVVGCLDEDITVRGDGTAAFPMRMFTQGLRTNFTHAGILAYGVLRRKEVMPNA